MVDILVRNVDDATAAQLKKKAKAAGKSVSDIAREALRAAAKPSKSGDLGRGRPNPSKNPGQSWSRSAAIPRPIYVRIATTTSDTGDIVVDASVAAKWILPQSEHSAHATALRDQEADLTAPSLVAAEIGSAIWKAVRQGTLGRSEGLDGFEAGSDLAFNH